MLKNKGYDAIGLTGGQAGIITDSNFSNAKIKMVMQENIIKYLESGDFMITDAHVQEISREQLLSDLKLTKTALDDAYSNFEQVVDPDLVDSYIYEVNAVQKRYHFLLKQVQLLDLQNALESELAVL